VPKPPELPVVQSAKFDLGVNLKALGVAAPQLLLAQANEVVE